MKHSVRNRMQSGFTLIQMSALITILGLTTAAVIPGGKEGQPVERQMTTEEKLDKVQTALAGYKAAYGRLPCPADGRVADTDANFGVAAPDFGVCTGSGAGLQASLTGATDVVGGIIPVRTLGLEDSLAVDGFGRRFTYVVDRRATDTSGCAALTPATVAMLMKDATGNVTRTYAAFISHGKSGYGAYPATGASVNTATGQVLPGTASALDADKRDNASITSSGAQLVDASFVKKERSGTFDDLVRTEDSCCAGTVCNEPPYDGPDAYWGGADCDGNPATRSNNVSYKLNNGAFNAISTPYLTAGMNTDEWFGSPPSPDNKYIVIKKYDGSYNRPIILKRSGMNYTALPANTLPNLPSSHFAGGKFTNGSKFFIATFQDGAVRWKIYQRSGDTFTEYYHPFLSDIEFTYVIDLPRDVNELNIYGFRAATGYFAKLFSYDDTGFTEMGNIPRFVGLSPNGQNGIEWVRYGTWENGQSALRLYTRTSDLAVWNLKGEAKIRTTYGMGGEFSPDGNYYAYSGTYGTVPFDVVKLTSNSLTRIDNFDYYQVNGLYSAFTVSWSYDGKYIASGGYDYGCNNKSAYYYRKVGDAFYYQGAFNPSPKSYAHSWGVYFRRP